MSASPSFERIDYQLRYNKHIERKLIFDVLFRAQQQIDFSRHQYLGFGSMWFSDFRLAHRLLGLDRMISMEREQHAARARFNAPYHSIEVRGGDSNKTLKAVDWSRPVIAWLDYDGTLEPSIVNDLKFVLERCAINSVVIVTLNAAHTNYRPKKVGARNRIDTALGQIEYMLMPGVVPARFEPGNTGPNHKDVSKDEFPEFFAESTLSFMTHLVNAGGGQSVSESGPPEPPDFVPLFNICHRDGVEMITVGGAVTSKSESNLWLDKIAASLPKTGGLKVPTHQRLDLVPLTLKEKLLLDSCLPEPEKNDFVSRARASGICLEDSELVKYWNHYRHFPVFFEAPV